LSTYQAVDGPRIVPSANGFAELNYPNITPRPSKALWSENRHSDHDDITAKIALVQSPKPERLLSLMRAPAGPLDPKGNLMKFSLSWIAVMTCLAIIGLFGDRV
jgi:hypothetical protein